MLRKTPHQFPIVDLPRKASYLDISQNISTQKTRPAIFLDRDGVIIANRAPYVLSWTDVEVLPGSLEALSRLALAHWAVVVVTNQACIGKGLLSIQEARKINQRLLEHITACGGRVDAIYMCPHIPGEQCICRKPKPGLLLQAAKDLHLELKSSILIGDALSDLQAGWKAGLHRLILVRTGRGRDQLQQAARAWKGPDFIVHENLLTAVRWLLLSQVSNDR
ncbi:MAG: HAD-IIIA family hydrolase [Gammaproteobacteria bacterium]|nr:MAG: HAD-IIIA family hydrolase [Gammaproteobacteria bacterium]